MVLLLVALALLALVRIKFSSFHQDYMGMDQTTAIKGIFAVLIVLSHMNSYLQAGGFLDGYYRRILWMIGQLMVTVFFFYSGYGIFCSWQRKPEYAKSFSAIGY